jgi:hypothetical protein
MKKRVLVGIFLFAWIPWFAWAQQDPGGFNGIPWDSDIGQRADFIALVEVRNYRIYVRSGEVHEIEGAEVEEIRYESYKDRFYSATVRFSGDRNFRLLLESLFRRYGPAEDRTKSIAEYEWSSSEVNVILRYYISQKSGSIEYQYIPVFDQITREENCCTP